MSSDKRVHFAVEPVFYSAPPTPSPTFSELSLPGSDGPVTPPSAVVALPAPKGQTAPVARLHPALAYRGPGGPMPIAWDVSKRPDVAQLSRNVLAEPATSPPMAALTILCDLLPYAITVHPGAVFAATSPYTPMLRPLPPLQGEQVPTAAPGAPFVSVNDVLSALYANLRLPLSQTEYSGYSAKFQAALSGAFKSRVARISDSRKAKDEHGKGIKRIDFLIAGGRTRFLGLGATKAGPNTWALALG